jgi:hypothetical protein
MLSTVRHFIPGIIRTIDDYALKIKADAERTGAVHHKLNDTVVPLSSFRECKVSAIIQ